MTQYNLEFFDTDLNCVHHDVVGEISVDDDYISAGESTVDISATTKVPSTGFINISGGARFFGYITGTEITSLYTTVKFKPLVYLFDKEIMFDTDLQHKVAVEKVIADLIKSYWINTTDSSQKMPILSVTTTSETVDWGMNLKSDTEGMHHCIIGMHSTMLTKAIQKWRISLTYEVNFSTKKINLKIGKNDQTFFIDSQLPNVLINTMKLDEASTECNKLEIWNEDNYTDKKYYYLHTDHTYDDKDQNRLIPVKWEVVSVAPERSTDADGNETVTKSFDVVAKEAASDRFSGVEWDNLIELSVDPNDALIAPFDINMGARVYILYGGTQYYSIFTGRRIDNQVMLIFGTVRHDLSKIIRMR